MRYFISALLTICIIAGSAGCDVFKGDDTSGPVTLTGLVINSVTSDPVAEAFVRVLPMDELGETDSDGRYRIEIDVDSTTTVSLTASKSGFTNATTTVLAVADRTIDVSAIRLEPDGTDPTDPGNEDSGKASNLLLLNQSASSIGIRESGSQEVAELVFQAADSLGRPISLDNQIRVSFSFGVDPGGGAFISPESAMTNENGEVRTNISSGTVAGVVQIVASATVEGRTILSKPVAISIHGGLPHRDHFGVATDKLNVPRAWDIWGLTANITAFVGDQFGNPVRPGTSVSFTTSAGIIGGSATTSDDGRGSVQLLSGPPPPIHPEFGAGYVTVTGSTADLNQTEITDEALVLFSGTSRIEVAPGQGPIEIGKAFDFYVYDQNQNPLGDGTNITVTASGTNVRSFGNTNSVLTDYLFGDHNFPGNTYGITRFSFGVQQGEDVDDLGNLIPAEIEAVTIKITSPNGNLERVVLQDGSVRKRDEAGKLVPVED